VRFDLLDLFRAIGSTSDPSPRALFVKQNED
jgi:hypothetical protein